MATITVDTYLDGGTARTAGEAWTIQNNARLTIRTDTRWHANAPASMTGSLAAQTVTEGEVLIDGRNVRWLTFDSGTGNVPAIGTTITQGEVSGYFLGVWETLTSAPTAVGAAMPTTGFIKFREVTGGNFGTGALTGIGASATGQDLNGWLEIVADQSTDITVPRLGRYRVYGDKFWLDNTSGSVGQVFQTPTNGGGVNTLAYGMWVETGVDTNVYEYWPSLYTAANGWAYQHVGMPPGESDIRQKLLKSIGSGQLQMGEYVTITGATYAATASTSGTYVEVSNTGVTYLWEDNKVYFMVSDHKYDTGEQVGVQFTAGGMFTPTNNTGIYTVSEVINQNVFAIDFAGSGQSGTATLRSRLGITITSNPLRVGYPVYLDFTTGNAVDGQYTIHSYNTTNSYNILYPRTAALTVGNVTEYSRITVTTSAAHNLQPGHKVKLRFTSGTAVDGVFVVNSIPTTTTFTINYPFFGGTGGSCELDFQLGYVAPAGCRVWVPNIFMRQCTTAARATNALPHNTIASRPEFITTASGDIDIDYAYTDWHMNFSQPYRCNLRNVAIADPGAGIYECNQTPIVRNIGISSSAATAIAANTYTLSSMQQGVDVDGIVGVRGAAPGTSQNGIYFGVIYGGTVNNIKNTFVNYLRPAASYGIIVEVCKDLAFENVNVLSSYFRIIAGKGIKVKSLDFCQYVTGTNYGYNVMSALQNESTPDGVLIDGVTWGFNGLVPDMMPSALQGLNTANDYTIRNVGTLQSPLQGRLTTYLQNGGVGTNVSTGSRAGFKAQNIYIDGAQTAFTDQNDGKDLEMSNYYVTVYTADRQVVYTSMNAKNSIYRNIGMAYASAGAASVFGSHFIDVVNYYYIANSPTRCTSGEFSLQMHEPSDQTLPYYTVVSGNPKFTAAGGVLMNVVGDSAIWEDQYFRKGYTGFDGRWTWSEPNITGGTYNYFIFEYQIDKGNGFNGEWKILLRSYAGGSGSNGAYTVSHTAPPLVEGVKTIEVGDYVWGSNISPNAKVVSIAGNTLTLDKQNFGTVSGIIRFSSIYRETGIDPAIGFRLKIKVTTVTAASPAITRIMVRTAYNTASLLQATYPLDTLTATFTGLVPGSDVVVRRHGTTDILGSVDQNPTSSWSFTYETPENVDVLIYRPGYMPNTTLRNYMLPSTDSSLPITQTPDSSYVE